MAVWLGKLTVAIAVGILLMLLLLLLDAFLAFVFFFRTKLRKLTQSENSFKDSFSVRAYWICHNWTRKHTLKCFAHHHTIPLEVDFDGTQHSEQMEQFSLSLSSQQYSIPLHHLQLFSTNHVCLLLVLRKSTVFSLSFQLFLNPTERCFSLLYYVINLLTNITLVSNLFIL